MKRNIQLVLNNCCFPKAKKSVSIDDDQTIPTNENIKSETIGPLNINELECVEAAEDIEDALLHLTEELAPIATQEDTSFKVAKDHIDYDIKSSKNNYVQSKIKENYLGIRWSTLTEVVKSNIKETMSRPERSLQEAMFEVISSEAKYYSGLEIIVDFFGKSSLFSPPNDNLGYVNPIDKHRVFLNIVKVMDASRRLLYDLEMRWVRDKPVLIDVSDILYKHATSESFKHYVIYISNQISQMDYFQKLMGNEMIKKELLLLESLEASKNLPFSSYLILPFQRLTRLKLLCQNILKMLQNKDLNKDAYGRQIQMAQMAIRQFENLLQLSQKDDVGMDYTAFLNDLNHKLDFPTDCQAVNIKDKILLKEGEFQFDSLQKFKSKKKSSCILLLFNDMLMVANRNGSRIQIIDYCTKKDVIFTKNHEFVVEGKSKAKNKLDNNLNIYLKLKNSCSAVFVEPVILTAEKSGIIDSWKTHLPDPNEP